MGGEPFVPGTRRIRHGPVTGRIRTFAAMLGVTLALMLVLPGTAQAGRGRAAPTLTVTADRLAIQPRSEPVRFTVISSEDANVTVVLSHAEGGADVSTLAKTEPVLAGVPLVLTWNGTDGAGNKAPDDRYVVTASGQGLNGTGTASASVWVDSVAPTIAWRNASPEPLTGTGSMDLSFDLADAGPPDQSMDVKLRVSDALGRVVLRTNAAQLDPGTGTLEWDGRVSGGRLAPNGLYTLMLIGTDIAGNVRESRALAVRVIRPVRSLKIHGVVNSGNRVALTFDDCESAQAWRSVLGTLERTHAQGTIFCSGYRVAALPQLARRTVAQGIPIGNHGWDHPRFTGLSDAQIRSQLSRTSAAWWRVAGATPIPYFRPPYGATNSRVERIAGQLGYRYTALWNVDPRDWSGISVSQVIHNVLSATRPGDIVVMHMKTVTAQALPAIIAGLRRRGLEPVSLPVLLRAGS